jgi:type I restriction enzyme S subunit
MAKQNTSNSSTPDFITEHLDIWTSAIKTKSAAGRGSSKKLELVGVKKLRELILELAVRGKLVPQDPNDEPASELLKKIETEKASLLKEGKIKKQKSLSPITDEEKMFELPEGWKWVRLQDICEYIQRGKGPKYSEFGIAKVISQKCVQWNGFDLNAARYIDDQSLIQYQDERFLKDNDLLWNSTGTGTAGRINILRKDDSDKLVADSHVTVIRAILKNAGFISSYVSSSGIQKRIAPGVENSLVSGTTNQVELNTSVVINLPVPIPPINEQHRIVAKVDELMALCDQLEAQTESSIDAHKTLFEVLLATLTDAKDADELNDNWQTISQYFDVLFTTQASIDQLKQTILQLAVMGKLVKQDPKDEPASKLLERIATEKQQLIKDGKIKKQKPLPPITGEEKPFELPKGWEWTKFEDLVDIKSGITKGRKLAGRELKTISYLSVANVQRGFLDLNNVKEIDIATDELEKYQVLFGDLLITEGGDWDKVGRTAIWRDEMPYVGHQNHVFKARCILSEQSETWLEKILNSKLCRDYFAGSSKQTTNLASINKTQLRGCLLVVPPLAEQDRIVTKVNELIAYCDSLKERLNQAQTTQLRLTDAIVEQSF